jgi:hypothetical protein
MEGHSSAQGAYEAADQPISHPISPLRQRMPEDMVMHGPREAMRHDTIRFVRNFAAFPGQPPDTATPEDIRRFQVYLHYPSNGMIRCVR